MSERTVYADNNATTMVAPEVRDEILPYLTDLYGNPSDIDYVIVNGKILKENGELTTIDRKESLLTAQKRTDEIIDRFFDDHPNQRENWEKMARKGQ